MAETKATYNANLYGDLVDGGRSSSEAAKIVDNGLDYRGWDCLACEGTGEDGWGERCDLCQGKGIIPARFGRYISQIVGQRDTAKRQLAELREKVRTLPERV